MASFGTCEEREVDGWLSVVRSLDLSVCRASVLALVCGACQSPKGEVEAPRAPKVFSEHRFLPAPQGLEKRQLGEECVTYGLSECESGLCFHAAADPSKGHVCSRSCVTDEACPDRWTCQSIHPSPGSAFCVPPKDWAPKAVTVRVSGASGKK